MEINQLIKKMGHSLVEIRVRALKSILCKLDHSLLSVSDLVQERMLFVFLLEWFNFPEVPMQEEILELLCTLSKHSSAAQMLRDTGAVEFLSQLSANVEPRLRAVIDSTLDHLFQLPQLPPGCSTVGSLERSVTAPTVPPAAPPEDCSHTVGYFQKSKPSRTGVPPQRIAVRDSVRCLKFSTFPWLALTTTDRHILSSNESSLRSNNPNLVRSTCELLQDVIMQDFPAEIFLQRPSIVQNLLSLLRVSLGEGETGKLRLQALACLRQLCVGLRSRLRFHRDPGFYAATQDPASQNSSLSQEGQLAQRSLASSPAGEGSPRPSAVGRTGQRARGDGQDGDAAPSSGSSDGGAAAAQAPRRTPRSPQPDDDDAAPDPGGEDTPELRMRQLSLAQFAAATLERGAPLLKTEGVRAFHRALELLREALALLGDSVCELVWDDHSLVGTELKEKLQACLEALGDVLSYHQNHPDDSSHSAVVFHRMAYTGTAVLTIRLLQTILPPEKASDNLPENMTTAILHLALDTALGTAFPSMQEAAVAYLEQVSPDGHELYRRATRAALWMESTCNFLKDAKAQGEKNWLELLELAHQAVDGLPYHQHLPVIPECIRICSQLGRCERPSPLLQTESQKILLKLLSHPVLPVRTETYSCVLRLVKECLGIQNVSQPSSSACSGVHFLLHPRVLYEISAFGLQDSAGKVNAAAEDVLLFLLKGQLVMTPSAWDRFVGALYPVVPVLQGYAGTEEVLGNCVLLISEVSDMAGDAVFSKTAQLRAALRLLFTKHLTVRQAAVQHILPHLMAAEGYNTARPAMDQSALACLPCLYCIRTTVDITLDTSRKSFLKVESVEKLFGVMTSDTVDLSLRRSAAEQLAMVLQDATMHPTLKRLGTADKVISFITESVNGNEGVDCLLDPCVCILRRLVFADPSLRHRLADRPPLLLTLLRASLLLKDNPSGASEAAALMCLLLFDEVARVDVWSDKSDSDVALAPFSLPVSVIRRYNIPFQAASHHAVSPYRCVLPLTSDLLAVAPARHALQLAWNTAWHSGIDNLLEELGGVRSDVIEFHDDLRLSEEQVAGLRASYLPAALQDCMQAVVTAAGHSSVTSALSRLRLYLLIDRLALAHSHAHSCSDTLRSLPWQQAISRFLQVRPACAEDERLLADVAAFLNAHFRQVRAERGAEGEDGDLRWMLELLLNQEGASLLDLLLGVETQALGRDQGSQEDLQSHISQGLQRQLTGLFNTLLHRISHTGDRLCLSLAGPFESQLAVCLLRSLRVSEAPRFYGLPSLERTLLAMVNLTARPGWSAHCPHMEPTSLCSRYLSGLLEVISSFYVEWGGNSASFMGKGVTKNAVVCLLQLSHEMMAHGPQDEDFISQWSLGQEAVSEEAAGSQLGLAWLIPLWVDRDPEVRFASLGVGSALSSVPSGCQALCASCQNISGGLWGTLLNIVLNQQEGSMVRREAAFILQNLLVMPMPANAEEAKDSQWQSPCVHDEVSGVSLVGLPALQALLYHCQYFQHVAVCAASCYLGRYTFPLQPPSLASRGPSPQDSTSEEDSLRLWSSDPPAAPANPSKASSTISTSSTVISPGGPGTHTPSAPSPVDATQHTTVSRLMAQGQSDTDTTDSVISQDSRQGEPTTKEPCNMVTPDLLTAHCGLLTNLLAVLPDFTLASLQDSQILQSLASLVDSALVEKCVRELKTPGAARGESEDIECQVVTLLQFLSSFSKLLQTCVMVSPELIGQLDFLKPLLANVVAILVLDTEDLAAGARDAVRACWADLLTLLATLVKRDGPAAHPSVSAALGRRWEAFAGTLSACVNESRAAPSSSLQAVALEFLSALFSAETKRRSAEPVASAGERADPLAAVLDGPAAPQLCDLLLQGSEKRSQQDPMKKQTTRALMSLLACSAPAQKHAATAGLIDSCVEQLKQSHAQLHLESIRPDRAAHRKKEESCLRDVRLAAEMLRNALYRNAECKAVATDAHLAPALHALWPWLLLDDSSMEAALELLCVYTANSTAACSSLCSSGSGVATSSRGSPGSSLMNSVMKLASSIAPDNSPTQKLAFALLANLAMARECRGLLQKSNFLHGFLSVPVPKAGGGKAVGGGGGAGGGGGGGGGLLGLWLRLLVSVSFGEDGQQSILRLTGALELLAELAWHRRHALLTLHNLCFCTANKPHILTSDKAMKVLLFSLESKETEVRSLGASALWALLHNNQKAKSTFKCPSVRSRLDEAHAASKKAAESRQDPLDAYLLKCLDNISLLLNS